MNIKLIFQYFKLSNFKGKKQKLNAFNYVLLCTLLLYVMMI